MNLLRKTALGIGIVLIVLIALFFHYTLPRTAVVQISGTDIKRIGQAGTVVERENEAGTQIAVGQHVSDVRFINSVSRKGKTMVFRNQDTGWGWPPYFKFNSADLTAKAQAYATDQDKPWVLVKYYGWRITVTSMFPNVLNLRVVDRNYTYIPVFNIAIVTLLVVFVFFVRRKIKMFVSWVRDRKQPKNGS